MKNMTLLCRKDENGLHVVSGSLRLKAALTLHDEVQVDVPNIGEVLISKHSDGSLIAKHKNQTLTVLGL